MIGGAETLAFVVPSTMAILMIGMACAFVRLVLGPTVPDRVVALDMISTLAVGVILVDAIATSRVQFLSAAVVLALVAFLGTIAFAYYMHRSSSHD